MNARTAERTDDQREIVGDLFRMTDTQPFLDQCVPRADAVKVTFALSCRSVECFTREAAKQSLAHQRMIGAHVLHANRPVRDELFARQIAGVAL